MIYFLLLTAFTVSIDSFACGFSLRSAGKKRLTVILCIAFTVFIMCAAANYAAIALSGALTERAAGAGGAVLCGVGIYNLFKKDGAGPFLKKNDAGAAGAVITGFAVGLDGAAANLSLALMGINAFYVPVIIAVMHALMIWLGILLADAPLFKKFAQLKFAPPLILSLLGIYKLAAAFL